MPRRTCLAIVLAAGEGTRMRSAQPKALHVLGGQSLLAHVMTAANAAGTGNLAIVVGPDHGAVAAEASRHAPKAQIFEQRERRGTAHAVLSAAKAIGNGADDVLVIFADTPLVRAEALSKLDPARAHGDRSDGASVVAHWAQAHAEPLARAKAFLDALERSGDLSIAKLTLANSQIRELASR